MKASTESAATIRSNLDTCLLGKAERWYTEGLNELSRSGLRNDPNDVTAWCEALETRFRESPGVSLARLETIRYTVRDVRARKDPEGCIQRIISNGKNAGLATTEYAQVMMAYQHMDGALRMTLPPVTSNTTMPAFIEHINVQKSNWFDVYQPFARGESTKNDRRRGVYKGDFNPKASPPFQSKVPYKEKERVLEREYRPFRNDGSNNKQDRPAIKQESERKDGPSKESGLRDSRGFDQNQNQNQNRGRRWNARLPLRPRNYLADASGKARSIRDEQAAYEEYEDDYYGEASYQDEEYGNENMDNPEEEDEYGEDTVEAQFTAGIVASHQCKKCKTSFPSNNLLHSHIRAKCTPKSPPGNLDPTPGPAPPRPRLTSTKKTPAKPPHTKATPKAAQLGLLLSRTPNQLPRFQQRRRPRSFDQPRWNHRRVEAATASEDGDMRLLRHALVDPMVRLLQSVWIPAAR